MRCEQKRIRAVYEWAGLLKNTPSGGTLDTDVAVYTTPMDLSAPWKAAVAMTGDYSVLGLAALSNTPSMLLPGLFHADTRMPDDFRLIRVTRSRRIDLVEPDSVHVQPAVLVEEFEELPPDYLYTDVPFEKRIVKNILTENLDHDDQVSRGLQCPVISAPKTSGVVGGVSLSSVAGHSAFARQLVSTIQKMVPPEYRSTQAPQFAHDGRKFLFMPGMRFHLADRPYSQQHILSGVHSTRYAALSRQLGKRKAFPGEYSVFSTLSPTKGAVTDVSKELLRNFNATEITLPQNLDEIQEADVDLHRLDKAIDEDLWLQIVHARQILPRLSQETDTVFARTASLLYKDLHAILEEVIKQDIDREYNVRSMVGPMQKNLKQIAGSLARSEERAEVTEDDIKLARGMLVDNLTGFMDHPEIMRTMAVMKKSRADARYAVIQTNMINNPGLTVREHYELIRSSGLFRGFADLQGLMDWMNEKGHVIVSRDRKYTWLGK